MSRLHKAVLLSMGSLGPACAAAEGGIGRAGNVLGDGGEVTGPVILAILVSGLVLHYGGERALFKMWGGLLLAALVIGTLKRFL